jgi:sirohydrochlorin ferrochelatase
VSVLIDRTEKEIDEFVLSHIKEGTTRLDAMEKTYGRHAMGVTPMYLASMMKVHFKTDGWPSVIVADSLRRLVDNVEVTEVADWVQRGSGYLGIGAVRYTGTEKTSKRAVSLDG